MQEENSKKILFAVLGVVLLILVGVGIGTGVYFLNKDKNENINDKGNITENEILKNAKSLNLNDNELKKITDELKNNITFSTIYNLDYYDAETGYNIFESKQEIYRFLVVCILTHDEIRQNMTDDDFVYYDDSDEIEGIKKEFLNKVINNIFAVEKIKDDTNNDNYISFLDSGGGETGLKIKVIDKLYNSNTKEYFLKIEFVNEELDKKERSAILTFIEKNNQKLIKSFIYTSDYSDKNENINDKDNNDNNLTEDEYDENLVSNEKYDDGFKYIEKYNERDNALVFYKYDEKDSKYKKIDKYYCETSKNENFQCSLDNGYENDLVYLIVDDTKLVLYNYEKGVIATAKDLEDIAVISRSTGGKYFTIKNDNKLAALITEDGTKIVDYKYQEIGKYSDSLDGISEYSFSIDNNYILYKNNNKWGILELTTGKVLVEAQYDDIDILLESEEDDFYNLSKKYYKAKENGKWYLYDLTNYKKVNTNGYDDIVFATDNVMVVKENGYVLIKDLKGNNLTNEKIKYYEETMEVCEVYRGGCGYDIRGVEPSFNKDHNILKIEILKDDECLWQDDNQSNPTVCENIYEFNLQTKELKQIN